MKGLYIAPVDSYIKEHLGINTKILGQINAFTNLGIDMDYIRMENDYIIMPNKKSESQIKRAKHYIFFKYIISNIEHIENEYEFVYIRFSFANPYMFKLAKLFKKRGVRVFIEIPTYPYENELESSLKNSILKIVDKILWRKNKNTIYRLVVTTPVEELFGIKCISIFNGIDIENLHKSKQIKEKNKIKLIAVANISKWHGYDRVIKGVSEYYLHNKKDVQIEFYLVGEGAEKENLERLASELKCDKYIKFLGAKHGKDLDEIFDKMDIGVSSLALFRAGGGHDPIKSKEYIGRGIPVLLGYKDIALDSNLEFVFNISSDDSAININDIIEKYNKINYTSDEIREYAKKNLSWISQMKKVINSL